MPKIKLIVEGGKMQPGPAVAQQLGPMGINMGKVISDVNEATAGFKGVKVPVELDVNAKTKSYEIVVFSPPVAELIKKELKLEKASGESGKMWAGNIAIERVISIADTKLESLLAKTLKAGVKLVVGTCVSIGVLVDGKDPREVIQEISEGVYDKEIDGKKTDVSPEKQKELDAKFKEISSAQEKSKKAAEEAAKAEEEAKAEAKAAAAAAAPAAGDKKEAGKKEEPKKEAAKPAGKK